MLRSKVLAAAIVAAGVAIASVPAAEAQKAGGACVNKAGEGTGSSKDAAMFQAWEAVLQATDWGMWASWMGSSQKVGTAPGYKVSKFSSKCSAGGLGQVCRTQATLCK